MAEHIIMPKTGVTVTDCILTKWYVKKGQFVKKGDNLFSYETDKTSAEEEAPLDGIVLDILCQEGDVVPCLATVCVIGKAGEAYTRSGAEGPSAAEEEVAPEKMTPRPAQNSTKAERPYRASPRARLLAGRMGLDLAALSPSGAEGRIIARDVEAAARKLPVSGETQSAQARPAIAQVMEDCRTEYDDTQLNNIRKTIARRMTQSLTEIPQLTHNISFDATNIQAMRQRFKNCQCNPRVVNVSINDMILYAVSRVLPHYTALNAHLLENTCLRVFRGVNLGMAVDTERGLLVPVIHNADKLSLTELSQRAHALAAAAREGRLSADDLANGSFTVSNLGMLRIESYTPVINPPQTGILGVCCPVWRQRPGANGNESYPAITLSLTYDHRALDGAPASRFLCALADFLENFDMMQFE